MGRVAQQHEFRAFGEIPGSVFSCKDTHFRISYAASDETIQRGIEAFRALARK